MIEVSEWSRPKVAHSQICININAPTSIFVLETSFILLFLHHLFTHLLPSSYSETSFILHLLNYFDTSQIQVNNYAPTFIFLPETSFILHLLIYFDTPLLPEIATESTIKPTKSTAS